MGNTSEHLKVLLPNDDQQVYSDKANYNFAKLLDLTGNTNSSGTIILLPGTKGDQGIEGSRGNLIYGVGGSDNLYPEIPDPIQGDTNINPDIYNISQYQEGTSPEWVEIIDFIPLLEDAALSVTVESGPLDRIDKNITFETYNEGTPANRDRMFLPGFRASSTLITNEDAKLRNGILSVYNDYADATQHAIIIGAETGEPVSFSNIDETLKIALRRTGTGTTALTSGNFNLTYTDPANITSHSGFEFSYSKFSLNVPEINTHQVYFGDGIFLNEKNVTFSTIVHGIGISIPNGTAQIGLTDVGDTTILSSTNIISIGGHMYPTSDNTFDLGKNSLTYKDIYISGDINTITGDSFYGDRSNAYGINVKLQYVGINTIAQDNPLYTITFGGNVGFSKDVINATIRVENEADTSGNDGKSLSLLAGKGGQNDTLGGPGGDLHLNAGDGGDSPTTSGWGGSVYINSGIAGAGASASKESYVYLGTPPDFNPSKNSNVGIHIENPRTSLYVGGSFGMLLKEITHPTAIVTDGSASIYGLSTGGLASGIITVTLDSKEQVPGKITTLKDIEGLVGTGGFTSYSIVPAGSSIDLGTINITSPYGYVSLVYYDKYYVIGQYGINIT